MKLLFLFFAISTFIFLPSALLHSQPYSPPRPDVVQAAELYATTSWFDKHCNGITRTRLLGYILDIRKDDQELFDLQKRVISEALALQWKRITFSQQKKLCFKALIMFGPKGSKYPSLLTASPALQKQLPLDIKKDLGF